MPLPAVSMDGLSFLLGPFPWEWRHWTIGLDQGVGRFRVAAVD
jgi:hypothetical protein